MAKIFAGLAAALPLMAAAPAVAEEERGPGPFVPDWRGSARQALEQLGRALDTLEGMVERLPSYGRPYMDEDGDIVIPRRDPLPPRRAPGDPDIVEI